MIVKREYQIKHWFIDIDMIVRAYIRDLTWLWGDERGISCYKDSWLVYLTGQFIIYLVEKTYDSVM